MSAIRWWCRPSDGDVNGRSTGRVAPASRYSPAAAGISPRLHRKMKPERGWLPGKLAGSRNQTRRRPYHAQAAEPQRKKETGAMAHLGGQPVVIGVSTGGLLA